MRTGRFVLIALVALLVGAALSAPAEAQIYSWRDAKGTLVISDRPMSPDAKTNHVRGAAMIRTTRHVSTLTRTGTYDQIIDRYAARYGVRSDLVRAGIQVESVFDPTARSPKGAMGLMQLMPQTANELGVINLYDPKQNIRGGATYLQCLIEHYDGNKELAVAVDNAGSGAVQDYSNQIPPYSETQSYVEKIGSTTGLKGKIRHRTGETSYKSYEEIDGFRISVYSNVKPTSNGYEVATEPR